MTSQLETIAKLRSVTSSPFPPESDPLRGRKRHRSLTRCDLEATHYGGTGESSTLRGRPRRRSTSPTPVSSRASSRATATAAAAVGMPSTDVSPMRKRLLRVVLLERRRSQSPSRSRSPDRQQAPPRRRRHRTRSRSRTHTITKENFQPKDQLPRLLLVEQAHKKVDQSVGV